VLVGVAVALLVPFAGNTLGAALVFLLLWVWVAALLLPLPTFLRK